MIWERYMVTGKRLDNGEIVKGYYMPQYHSAKHGCRVNAIFFSDDYGTYRIPIDPSTVEPVAVAAISVEIPMGEGGGIIDGETHYYCPNCKERFCNMNIKTNYCCDCGQRLLW